MKYASVLLCCCLYITTAVADGLPRQGFWGSIDIGGGSLAMKPEIASSHTGTYLYMGFQGGYTLHPQLQLGVEASGWNIEAGDLWNPDEGEGLMQLFVLARIWPAADSKLLFKLAGGSVNHWDHAPGANSGSGSGYCVGMAYEIARYGGVESHWFLNYSSGSISGYTPRNGVEQDEDYTALTTGLSLGF